MLIMAVGMLVLSACSDDRHKTKELPSFDEALVKGTWRITAIDTMGQDERGLKVVISSVKSKSAALVMENGNYRFLEEDVEMEKGTYQFSSSPRSYWFFFTHGGVIDTLAYLKSEGSTMLKLRRHPNKKMSIDYTLIR